MKKQSLWFLLIGALCIALPVFTRSSLAISDTWGDFLIGFGVGLMIAALFIQRNAGRSKNRNLP